VHPTSTTIKNQESVKDLNVKNFRQKSLNIQKRKKESERIERENNMFAKRLYSNSGSISRKQLEVEF
jgi:hypothetical protein